MLFDYWDCTSLHRIIGIGYCDIEDIKVVLKNGAYINERDFAGRTPLITSVEARRPEFVEFLINKGADVNIKSNHGSALEIAERGLVRIPEEAETLKRIIQLLKEAGAK